jgi:hypothetical protein
MEAERASKGTSRACFQELLVFPQNDFKKDTRTDEDDIGKVARGEAPL